MKLGFLFPGQGAQFVGMGKDLYEKYDEAKDIYNKAGDILGIDIAKLTFESSEEELSKTKNTQICILVMSLGILEVLKNKKIEADYMAGLSLGEYSALIYSGILNLEDGIKIVKKRGEYMQEYVPDGTWSMAAIIGAEDEIVIRSCQKASEYGFVVPANFNCPGQVAISGEKLAVEKAMEIAKELGARRTIELKTSGPFHTEKLIEASKMLRKDLEEIKVNNNFTKHVIKNIDATEYKKEDDIREILSKHVISPVQFSKSVKYMIEQGVDTFIEIGPGKVLSGFVKKISKDVKIMNIQDVESMEECCNKIEI